MNRLSAIDAFGPAFTRVGTLLFQRFRVGIWLRFGLIGLLGGGLVTAGGGGGNSFHPPDLNSRLPNGEASPFADIARALRSVHLADYIHIFVIVFVAIVVLALVFQYLFCRFRFILFDAVVTGQPEIGKGWKKYGSQAYRYFGFWLAYRLTYWGALFMIVGVPLLHAYQAGVFSRDNSVPELLAVFAPIGLSLLLVSICFAVVSTLVKDFVLPVLALDDFTLGDAWAAVWRVVSSEPGAWALYMVMKLVSAFLAGIAFAITFVIALIPSLIIVGIPAGILIGLGVFIKAGSVAGGVILCGIGVLLLVAGIFFVLLLLAAPVSVFFASYAFYFFGGRYPKLAALLWPQPIPPAPQPMMPGVRPAL